MVGAEAAAAPLCVTLWCGLVLIGLAHPLPLLLTVCQTDGIGERSLDLSFLSSGAVWRAGGTYGSDLHTPIEELGSQCKRKPIGASRPDLV